MATDKKKYEPFIVASHRHDVLARLARPRTDAIDEAVNATIARAIASVEKPGGKPKEDGKNGAIDGGVGPEWEIIAEDPWGFPRPPTHFPKGKEDKEGKEQKDGKEGKEGKESKDSKEGKDSSDSGKTAGDESSNILVLYGDPAALAWGALNQIAQLQPERIALLLKTKAAII